jgi:protein EFR3
MVEETIPTFETFCAHQDPANLAADQEHIRQYEDIIRMYAAFASKDTPIQVKTAKSVPVLMRYRKAGLEAIKAVATSDSLSSETGRQLQHIIPPILENIYAETGQYLVLLESTEEERAEIEKEKMIRRRQSTSTVRTVETSEADPIAASGTTEAADRLAEQETGVIALQALKKIFTIVPRGQLRMATAEVLKFMADRITPQDHFPTSTTSTLQTGSWPCTLFGLICGWAPVQDRYAILVTAMETLVRSPIIEDDLEKQYVLATIVGWLLSSDINFIGLSVMDVLVGLIQHILLLLQLGGEGTNIHPHGQQADVINAADFAGHATTTPASREVVMEVVSIPSSARKALLKQLQRCIGSLAVHVYYSDQIVDMVTAILARLKPSPMSSIPSTASAIENPTEAVNVIASSGSLSERPNTDGFFSFETARVEALGAIQEIIAWANATKSDGSPNTFVRSPLTTMQWEGTQWLLLDPNWEGRAAYVQTLLVWMKYEVKKKDLRVDEDKKHGRSERKENGTKNGSLTKRAVSNASNREKSPLRRRHTFMQLLHLAIYENAHQYAESDCDILILHLLLTHLVQKVGVNAVQHGLPMILRLQEDIVGIESPQAKINVGSLVHGYLWAISTYFDFDASATGRDIQNEINRRMSHGMWLNGLKMPPMPYDQIVHRAKFPPRDQLPAEVVESEALKPFDNRSVLVDKIAEGYTMAVYSPPVSPPSSPGRQYSVPILGTVTHPLPPAPKLSNQLPQRAKEALLSDWTREACIASTTKSEGSRSGSTNGSPSATYSGSRHLPVNVPGTANGTNATLNGDSTHSPHRSQHHHHHAHLHGSRPPSAAAYGLVHGVGVAKTRSRRTSASPTHLTSSSARSAVRVEDLKRVLSGSQLAYPYVGTSHGTRGGIEADEAEDTGSDSMVSYEGSDASYVISNNAGGLGADQVDTRDFLASRDRDGLTEGSVTPRPLTAASTAKPPSSMQTQYHQKDDPITERRSEDDDDNIPPVPPLPPNLRGASPTPTTQRPMSKLSVSPPRTVDIIEKARPRTSASMRSGPRSISAAFSSTGGDLFSSAKDVWGFSAREFLEGIDAEGGPGSGVGRTVVRRPPY